MNNVPALKTYSLSLKELCAKEGRYLRDVLGVNNGLYSKTLTYQAGNLSGTFGVPAGRTYYIDSLNIFFWTEAPLGLIDLQLRIGYSPSGVSASLPVQSAHIYMKSGVPINVPINAFLHDTMTIECYLFPLIDATDATKKVIMTISPAGVHDLTADLNFTAQKTIWSLGDSITFGGLGASSAENIFLFMMRDYYKAKGSDVRLVNAGIEGLKSTDLAPLLNRGYLQCTSKPDIITWMFGRNDVTSAFGTTEQNAYNASIDFLFAWKQKNYPTSKLIMMGPSPDVNTTIEARLVTARSLVSAKVTAAADSLIKYCNMGTSFTATTSSNYVDGTHPNDQGNLNMYNNALKPFLDSNIPTI